MPSEIFWMFLEFPDSFTLLWSTFLNKSKDKNRMPVIQKKLAGITHSGQEIPTSALSCYLSTVAIILVYPSVKCPYLTLKATDNYRQYKILLICECDSYLALIGSFFVSCDSWTKCEIKIKYCQYHYPNSNTIDWNIKWTGFLNGSTLK